jgi:hypothetical protein
MGCGPIARRSRAFFLFQNIFVGSTYRSRLIDLAFVGEDVAVALAEIDVTGSSRLPPGVTPTREGVLTTRMRHVLHRRGGRWWIVATQNTAVLPVAAAG